MRPLTETEIGNVTGSLKVLDDIASAAGKDLAEFINDAEYVYNAIKTRVLIAQALPN